MISKRATATMDLAIDTLTEFDAKLCARFGRRRGRQFTHQWMAGGGAKTAYESALDTIRDAEFECLALLFIDVCGYADEYATWLDECGEPRFEQARDLAEKLGLLEPTGAQL